MVETPAAPPLPSSRPVRAWPAIVLLVIYWIVMAVIQQSDLAMFPRFLSRMAPFGAGSAWRHSGSSWPEPWWRSSWRTARSTR